MMTPSHCRSCRTQRDPSTSWDGYQGWGITNSVSMYDVHDSVLQVVRTRMRADWTDQDMERRYERSAHSWDEVPDLISNEWVLQNHRRKLQQINRMPAYNRREDRATLSMFDGFSAVAKPESCRVDRHFVGHGYYFQLIAVAYHLTPDHDLCTVASELAAWASENIRIGGGCRRNTGGLAPQP